MFLNRLITINSSSDDIVVDGRSSIIYETEALRYMGRGSPVILRMKRRSCPVSSVASGVLSRVLTAPWGTWTEDIALPQSVIKWGI